MSSALPIKSGIVLWVLAPGLLWLSLYRPYGGTAGRAEQLPMQVADYTATGEQLLTDQHRALLGTDDAVWRCYKDAQERELWVTCVFHGENWKSIHPPHICLEGSNMTILEDGSTTFGVSGEDVTVGRITTHFHGPNRPYVSLFVYAAPDFRSHSYAAFFWHHLPKAIFRRSTSGFLLRVETTAGEGETVDDAEGRCRALMRELLPAAEKTL